MARMKGGSAGSEAMGNNNGVFGFLKGGSSVYFGGKKATKVRILPAFDFNLSDKDPKFLSSVAPYRDAALGHDPDTKSIAFTPWFGVVQAYRMLGNTQEDIVSARSKITAEGVTADDMADPIFDCFKLAQNDNRWKHFTEGADGEYPVLDKPKGFALFNTLLQQQGDQRWRETAYGVPYMGLKEIKIMLTWPSIYGVEPRDKNWERFLLGDVTHPQTGLVAQAVQRTVGTITPWTLAFTTLDGQPNDLQVMPVGQEALLSRKDFWETDTGALRFESYQTLVDWMVVDGFIDYELIEAACSARCKMPPKPLNYGAAVPKGQQSQPAQPLSSSVPSNSQPAPAAEEPKFWVAVNGSTLAQPVGMPQVKAYAQEYGVVQYLPVDNSSPWANLERVVPPAIPTPPAPPTPPVAPVPPAAPTAVSAPPTEYVAATQAPNGPSAAVQQRINTPDELPMEHPPRPATTGPNSAPVSQPLSAEELSERVRLQGDMENLDSAGLARLAHLESRARLNRQ